MTSKSKIPVTLLSGFLGSGKTTLLKHILTQEHGFKIALIVNDLASLNIDASLIRSSGLVQVKQELVQLQNGCICCTLRGDLIREISRLHGENLYDYILIESTGLAEPMHVAESFSLDIDTEELPKNDNTSISTILSEIAFLDTCVTVVNTSDFINVLESSKSMFDYFGEGEKDSEETERNIGNLLVDQVEFANLIVLNKIDLATPQQLATCRETISKLNPSAKIIEACYSKVDIKEILNTRTFSLDEMQLKPGWMLELKLGKVAKPESEEYGVSSFVYKARKPFNPTKLYSWIKASFISSQELLHPQFGDENAFKERLSHLVHNYGWIIRSKGFCWIASRNDFMSEWSHSGRILDILTSGSPWFTDLSEDEWGMDSKEIEIVKNDFEGVTGDRRQEIVFIGANLNINAISSALNECLMSENEMNQIAREKNGFLKLCDPLPNWTKTINPGFIHFLLNLHREEAIIIPPRLTLNLSMVTLEFDDVDQLQSTLLGVKVWVDFATRSVLLATLFPHSKTEVSMKILIDAFESEIPVTFRLELFPQ
eukprot:gene11517-15427_t